MTRQPGQPRRSRGELHVDLDGEKLRGRFVLVRTDVDSTGKEQWLLLHKHDEHAVDGWDAEDHPRSVLTGRTNDEVAGRPGPAVALRPAGRRGRPSSSKCCRRGADRRRAGRARCVRRGRHVDVFGRELRVTNLDKVLFPAPRAREAGDQARVPALRGADRTDPAAVPDAGARSTCTASQRRRRAQRVLAQGAADARARLAAPMGQPGRRRGRDPHLPGRRRAGGARLGGELRRARVACVDVRRSTRRSNRRTR